MQAEENAKLASEGQAMRRRLAELLRSPWYAATELEVPVEKELARELHPKHDLWAESFSLVARRRDRDDFAFLLAGGRVATVHLTFKGAREHGPWPFAAISSSLAEWLVEVAESDSREWDSREEISGPDESS